jgi:hypothetical protein
LNTFEPEVGFNISGVVKRIIGNKTIPEIKIILGLFSKNTTQFHDTMTDKNGKYRFEGIDIQGTTKVIVSSTGKSERGKGLIFLDSLKYDPPDIELLNQDSVESMILAKQIPVYRQEAIVRTGMKKKYKLSDTIKVGEVVIAATRIETPQEIRIKESRRIYSTPDKELVISVASENFAGNVISYMSGRIAGVRVENDTKILLRGNIDPPLILLDGFEIDSVGLPFLTGLPMNIIDRIDVLYASPLYGMRGANGVINIITKVGVRRNPETLMPNSAYASIQGYNIPRVFYSPKYDSKTEQTFLPDYRSTIFWEPNISIERNSIAKLEYFNAGNPAKISILVEGITEEGIPLTGKVMYDVK